MKFHGASEMAERILSHDDSAPPLTEGNLRFLARSYLENKVELLQMRKFLENIGHLEWFYEERGSL